MTLEAARTRIEQLESQIDELRRDLAEVTRRNQLTSTMLRASTEINSSLSFSEVVRQIIENVDNLLAARTCCIMLVDPMTDELRVVGSHGIDKTKAQKLTFKRGVGIAGWVLEHGEPVIIADAMADPRFVPGPGQVEHGSVACVPLMGNRAVMGILNVDRAPGDHPFDADDVIYLKVLADHAAVALKNARLHEDLLQRATQLSTLYEVGSALSSVLNVDRLLALIIDSVVRVTGAQICSLMLLDTDKKCLRVRVARGLSEEVIRNIRVELNEESISGYVAKTGEPLLIKDIETHPLFQRRSSKKYSSKSCLSVPLKIKGEVIGVLNVNNKLPDGTFTEDDQNLLTLFASHAAVTIENANLYEHLERLATTDGLTGLFVHRYFQEQLSTEMNRAVRFKRPLSVVMMDIDHFKLLNDTWGHQTGDVVLRQVANILLARGGRDADILARYGGEEFILTLVETELRDALKVGNRIREMVERHEFMGPEGRMPVTISLGVASYPRDADNKDALIKSADDGLYHAKENGRNRVGYHDENGTLYIYEPTA